MPPSNKKKQLNSIVCDNKINDNININTNAKHDNSTENFFGILIEKPPSPINISIDDTHKENIQSNTSLDINIEHNTITNTHEQPKNIIYSNIELKKRIELLSEHEYCEVFRIIKNNKEKYSTNNNGIFINLSTLNKISIQEISNLLLFCENNNKILEKEEELRAMYRDLVSEN